MKVCFLLPNFALSGGVGVVIKHAQGLASNHGFEVTIALTEDDARVSQWEYAAEHHFRLVSFSEACAMEFDVAIATWWKTAYLLFDVPAKRYAYFVQSMEERFYADRTIDYVQSRLTHGLPVSFITEASWIDQLLRQIRPDADCYLVRNGIDKDVYRPLEAVEPSLDQPLKIMIEGHPDVALKGIPEAYAAIAEMTEPHQVVHVTPEPPAGTTPDDVELVGPLTAIEMAAQYEQSDVVLKLSRVEGMFGPPLEGFHKGATCVVTPVTGHDEYVSHGWNGIIVDWDDARGTARWLDILSRDRRLLHRLRVNALKTAQAWPSWDQSTQFFAVALNEIYEKPAASVAPAMGSLMRDVRDSTEQMRRYISILGAESGDWLTWGAGIDALHADRVRLQYLEGLRLFRAASGAKRFYCRVVGRLRSIAGRLINRRAAGPEPFESPF